MLATCFIILAVDFKSVFPHCSTKSRYFGVSLMDLGSGQFIFLNALAYRLRGSGSPFERLVRSVRSGLGLFALGAVRLALTSGLHYGVDEHEYGRHLNFFFILGLVQILVALADVALGGRRLFRAGLLVLLAHRAFLSSADNEAYLLSDLRTGGSLFASLVAQNKEGVSQIVGYTGMFLACSRIGLYLQDQALSDPWLHPRRVRVAAPLLAGSGLLWLATQALSEFSEPPSRRLANGTYVVWVTAFSLFVLSAYVAVHAWTRAPPLAISAAVSHNMLPLFLFSNVAVGIANSVANLAAFSPQDAVLIMVGFTAMLCLLAVYLEEAIRSVFLALSFGGGDK